MKLRDRNVVVIGGSSGIGLAAADAARQLEANVTIVGRSEKKLHAALAQLQGARAVAADIADEASVQKIFDGFDRIDHVYISAGTYHHGNFLRTEVTALRRVIDERVWGPLYVVRAAKPLMTSGSITFTTGTLSSRPRVGAVMQSVALAAVEALVRGLALELAPVRVNAVCAGPVDTPLQTSIYGAEKSSHLKSRATVLPAGRVGSAQEIADAVMLLMTNEYIDGEILHVDGGARLTL